MCKFGFLNQPGPLEPNQISFVEIFFVDISLICLSLVQLNVLYFELVDKLSSLKHIQDTWNLRRTYLNNATLEAYS